MEEQIKKCTKCGPKPASEFGKNKTKTDGLATECKECVRKAGKAYYAAHKEKWVAYQAKREADPQFAVKAKEASARHRLSPTNTIRLRYLKDRYGITPEQYFAMEDAQGGVCAICRRQARGSDRRLHVDHNHITDKIRGLLCFNCNAGLGNFADNIEWLRAAIAYLERDIDSGVPEMVGSET